LEHYGAFGVELFHGLLPAPAVYAQCG